VTEIKNNVDYDITIEAGKSDKYYWKDVWTYRELFYFLAWRDIIVKFKQTKLGFLWAFLQPFLTLIILTVIFSNIAQLPSILGVPYAVLVFCGILPWTLFSDIFSNTGGSLLGNTSILTKIYFPRIIIPLSAMVVALLNFIISLVIFVGVLIWFNYIPLWTIVLIPIFIFLVSCFAIGLGLIVACLNVKYRDFKYIIPFILTFGIYISPVGYIGSIVPPALSLIYTLNPMVGYINGFRWAIIG
jgi:lipopolysaccharide transport system permease protein